MIDNILGCIKLKIPNEIIPKVFGFIAEAEIPYNCFTSENGNVTVNIPLRYYKAVKKLGVEYKFCGLFAFLYQYRKRWGILIGTIIFSVIISLSGKYIWSVEITGNKSVKDEYIENILKSNGVYVGGKIKGLDFSVINNKFLVQSEDVAWISVNLEGTVANVELREIIYDREKDENTYNIVASEDGQIERVENIEGMPCVEINDTVKKGELLIGGVYAYGENKFKIESAEGSVFAKVNRSFDVEMPYETEEKKYTGDITKDYSLVFFKKNINIVKNYRNSYKLYDIIKDIKRKSICGRYLPLELSCVTYREYEKINVVLSETEARDICLSLYTEKLKDTVGDAQLLSKKVIGYAGEKSYKIHCELFLLADIAEKIPLQIQNGVN